MRQSKQEANHTTNFSQQLESDRDELLDERESFLAQNRHLEDKIVKLEAILAQQTEFIEQNETELAQRNHADVELVKVKRRLAECEQFFNSQIGDKIEAIEKLEEQLRNKRYFLFDSKILSLFKDT